MSLYQAMTIAAAQRGKVFVSGTLVPASGSVNVATGLSAIDHAEVSLAAPPTINHSMSHAMPTGGSPGEVRIQSWKPTDATNASLIPSTVEVAVSWFAIGDR